jgi:hypothetical protein
MKRAEMDFTRRRFLVSTAKAGSLAAALGSAGIIAFTPTSDAFHRARKAMDGSYPTGSSLNLNERTQAGFNQFLHTTHRQNFLVPPRAHRSFPLAEYV